MPAKKKGDKGGGGGGGRTGRKGDKGGGGDGRPTGGKRDKVYDISNLSIHSGSDARSPSVTIKVILAAFPLGSCFSHRVIIDPELPLPVLSEPAATPD